MAALGKTCEALQHRGARTVRVGTFFSGTEVARHSVETSFALWGQLLGASLKLEHVFSIEHMGWIRDFIREHMTPGRLFDCVLKLAADNWKGTDLLTGQKGDSIPVAAATAAAAAATAAAAAAAVTPVAADLSTVAGICFAHSDLFDVQPIRL